MADRLNLRRASAADAALVGDLNVRAWQAAYRGQLPDRFLDGMDTAERAEGWRSYLLDEPDGFRLWLAERDGSLLGYARTGPDEEAGEGAAQVYGLYVEPAEVGTGLGRALFEHALADLRQRGFREATVWTFEGNERAIRFYRAAGFEPDGATGSVDLDGFSAPELRFRAALGRSAAPPS